MDGRFLARVEAVVANDPALESEVVDCGTRICERASMVFVSQRIDESEDVTGVRTDGRFRAGGSVEQVITKSKRVTGFDIKNE